MDREFGTDIQTLIQPGFTVTPTTFNGVTYNYGRVYLPGERPDIPVDLTLRRAYFPFVTVFPSRRFASDVRRLSSDSSVIAWRFAVECVGLTWSQVAYAEEKVRAAVEQKRISLAGYSSTPIQYESSSPADLNSSLDEFQVSTSVWTTVSTRAHAA